MEAQAGDESSEARVVVWVEDQNDHAPVFPTSLHETQITEEDDRHLPKTILTVSMSFSYVLKFLWLSFIYRISFPDGTECQFYSFMIRTLCGLSFYRYSK